MYVVFVIEINLNFVNFQAIYTQMVHYRTVLSWSNQCNAHFGLDENN